MLIELFARGLVIGLAVAAPVGPIGMLVINRTLTEGRLSGLATGLGAAVADTLYGCVGAFGLTFISNLLMGYAPWTKLVGGLFLCYLGIKTIRARPRENGTTASRVRPVVAFSTTVLLTLANPVTILMFMAVFAGLGFGSGNGTYDAASVVVAGVFTGSMLWWLILTEGLSLLRHRLAPGIIRWIDLGSGALLFLFGATAVLSLI
jgi:threonine/homoserine/homoserine lactone efflux protein